MKIQECCEGEHQVDFNLNTTDKSFLLCGRRPSHLFIGTLREAGDTCPLPGSLSKQIHSRGDSRKKQCSMTAYFNSGVCLVPLNLFSIAVSVHVVVVSDLDTTHTSVLISVSQGCFCLSAQGAERGSVARYQQV